MAERPPREYHPAAIAWALHNWQDVLTLAESDASFCFNRYVLAWSEFEADIHLTVAMLGPGPRAIYALYCLCCYEPAQIMARLGWTPRMYNRQWDLLVYGLVRRLGRDVEYYQPIRGKGPVPAGRADYPVDWGPVGEVAC